MIEQVFYKTLQIFSGLQAFVYNLLREVPIENFTQVDYSCVAAGLPSICPDLGQCRLFMFPEKTVCDMFLAHLLLRKHLGIRYVHAVKRGAFCVGRKGECGNRQLLIILFINVILIPSALGTFQWVIAFNFFEKKSMFLFAHFI